MTAKRPPLKLMWWESARDRLAELPEDDRLLVAGVLFVRGATANNDGSRSEESQTTVARRLGIHRTTVAKADRLAAELGLIESSKDRWPARYVHRLRLPTREEAHTDDP